jgi:micrococcal nuclease
MRLRRPLTIALTVFVLLTTAACSRLPSHRPPPVAGGQATVVRVVDGDTVILRIGHDDERVRLIGIDTPETVKPNTPVQCWGPQASAHMKHVLTPGTAVRVARDAEPRDKYGRLLLYIWRAHDGLFVNLDLATGGWARQLTIPPNTGHESQFAAAVSRAEAQRKGLWGACPATPQ